MRGQPTPAWPARAGHAGVARPRRVQKDDVSLTLHARETPHARETLAIVGESGSGKSPPALTMPRVLPPAAQVMQGQMLFEGESMVQKSEEEMRKVRGKRIGMILQDPMASLNPRMRVRDITSEPLVANGDLPAATVRDRVREMLDLVGLPARSADLFPHELSGCQRQRIAIARVLSLSPRLIVLDEPVSALDVSIRAQILNLLTDLRDRLGLSYLCVAHDLAAVGHMSHTIIVMYLGKIAESGEARALARSPMHPWATRNNNRSSWCWVGSLRVMAGADPPSPVLQC